MKLFAAEYYYEKCAYIINAVNFFSALSFAIRLLPSRVLKVSLFGKLFDIRPMAVGLFSMNVFAVRHFAIDFSR